MLRWHSMVLYCNNAQSFHRSIRFERRLHIYVVARLISFEEIFHACAFAFSVRLAIIHECENGEHSDMFLLRTKHLPVYSPLYYTLDDSWLFLYSLCRNLLANPFHTHIFWLDDFFHKRHKRMTLLWNPLFNLKFREYFSYSEQIRHPKYLSTISNELFAICGGIEFALKIEDTNNSGNILLL